MEQPMLKWTANVNADSQCECGQPTKQTRGVFFTGESGVARCQSQQQCHFLRMNSMFEVYCTDK